MATQDEHKIKRLLDLHSPGTVLLPSWLEARGISRDLQAYYRRSGWLEAVGVGALKRPHEELTWQGGVHSLQIQAQLPVHIGAITALSMQGLAHYVRFGEAVYLFSPPKTTLPGWFRSRDWGVSINHINTKFLPVDLGLMTQEQKTFSISLATPERAMLECLYLAPDRLDLVECYQVMEGLVNLRPGLVRQLLEACSSVKVKRLFLYMADKAEHQWFEALDTAGLELGSGDRSVGRGGVYVSKYKISIPQELAQT